jgi:mannosyltransferase
MTSPATALPDIELILGNSNPKFSGVTSTMLQTIPHQKQRYNLRVLGQHHLPNSSEGMSFREALQLLRVPTKSGKPRIFHARRNNEMLQALALRALSPTPLKICFTSTAQRHHSKFTKALMERMDGIISTCEEAAAYLEKKPDRIIPHGVNCDTWFPSSSQPTELQNLGIFARDGAIGIFGRVREQKGVHIFVRACIEVLPKHPQFCAFIVGKTDDQALVQQLKLEIDKHDLSKQIIFLGEQDFERIPKIMRCMNLICALSDYEGFGLTVLEAMASGCAVIATQAGAWRSLVQENITGAVMSNRSVSELAGTLNKLLSERAKLDSMGQRARELAETQYPIEKEANALCDYYCELQSRA